MSILAFFERLTAADEPPVDVEADAIIRAMLKRFPDAAYRMTRLAMAASALPAPEPAPEARPRSWFSTLLHRGQDYVS